jgi:6,7-dimethyl-8-ribityllumazine synthase
MQAKDYAVTVVVSRWNELVTKELLAGCLDELSRYGVEDPKVIRVPGTWEIPVVVKRVLTGARSPQAIIALGCILQGKTSHAQLLAGDVAGALMGLQVEFGIPIAWGILTPDDQEQALERAGMKLGNKGREAAQAAIEMASLLEIL